MARFHQRSSGGGQRIERLETRLTMAGDVAVAVVNGDLLITGDALGNAIYAEGTGNPGEIRVSGTEYLVTGPTTVNGGASQLFSGVTGSVIAQMGDGDDYMALNNAYIAGAVVFEGGDAAVAGDAFVGGTNAAAGPLSMGRELSLRGIGLTVIQEFVQVGTSEIIQGSGITLQTRDVNPAIGCSTGQDFVVRIEDVSSLNRVTLERLTVSRYFSYDASQASNAIDLVTMRLSSVGNSALFNMGTRGDQINIDTVFFATSVTIDMGPNPDVFEALAFNNSVVQGSMGVVFRGGPAAERSSAAFANVQAGLMRVELLGATNDNVQFTGSVIEDLFVNLGQGDDTLSTRANRVVIRTTLDGGAGDDLWEELGNNMAGLTFANFERYRFA